MKTKLTLLLIAMFFTACSSLQVSTDFDPKVAINQKNSFAIKHKSSSDSLSEDRMNGAIASALEAKGYQKVPLAQADFIVLYESGQENQTDVEPEYIPMGFYGMAGYTTMDTFNYTEGTLDIRMADPKSKKVFWSANATNDMETKKTPQERTTYVDGLVSQILAKYPQKQ